MAGRCPCQPRRGALALASALALVSLSLAQSPAAGVPEWRWAAVADVRTAGNAGFEAFRTTAGGQLMLGAANFWDGRARDMSAYSQLWEVSKSSPGSADGPAALALRSAQRLRGKGAHGLVRQRSSLLKAVITAFPCVSLPFLAVPLLSQRT
eukprot:SAG22_NODE_700_length_7794_cov_27.105263_4_plen_151_part_01